MQPGHDLPRIGCAGYFGYANLGDEWFFSTWRELFAGRAHVRVLHPYDETDDLDGIIIGGGDIVTPTPNNHYWNPDWAQQDRPVWVYGVGVPATTWTEEQLDLYRAFFALCQGVWARDEASLQWCLACGADAHRVEDIAWGADLPRARVRVPLALDRKVFGLSIRPLPRYASELCTQQLVGLCHDMWEMGYQTLLLPLQCPALPTVEDYTMHADLQARINATCGTIAHVAPPGLDNEHRIALIGACDIYGTMRFHGLLAGLRYGVRSRAIITPRDNKFLRLEEELEATLCGSTFTEWAAALMQPDSPLLPARVLRKKETSRTQLEQFRELVLARLEAA